MFVKEFLGDLVDLATACFQGRLDSLLVLVTLLLRDLLLCGGLSDFDLFFPHSPWLSYEMCDKVAIAKTFDGWHAGDTLHLGVNARNCQSSSFHFQTLFGIETVRPTRDFIHLSISLKYHCTK